MKNKKTPQIILLVFLSVSWIVLCIWFVIDLIKSIL